MHMGSLLRMQWFVQKYLGHATAQVPLRVLEIGSYDINGSYKQFFDENNFSYTGLDMVEGANVDIVPASPYKWNEISNDTYDVVISGQVLEHAEFFWVTVGEMIRVLKPNGLLCIIVPRGFNRHRCPVDCYRFDTDGVVAIARYFSLNILHASTNLAPKDAPPRWYSLDCFDTMLIAQKPEHWSGIIDISNYTCVPANLEELATGFIELEKQHYYAQVMGKSS